jgi:hypothetical protein
MNQTGVRTTAKQYRNTNWFTSWFINRMPDWLTISTTDSAPSSPQSMKCNHMSDLQHNTMQHNTTHSAPLGSYGVRCIYERAVRHAVHLLHPPHIPNEPQRGHDTAVASARL